MIRCGDGSLYTGITTDLNRRLEEHQSVASNGSNKKLKGAKALRGKGPLNLELSYGVEDRSIASKLEYRIKQLSKPEKEKLVSGVWSISDIEHEIVADGQ